MKNKYYTIIGVLAIIMIVLLGIIVYLLHDKNNGNTGTDSSVTASETKSSNVPKELIGHWEGSYKQYLDITENGIVYLYKKYTDDNSEWISSGYAGTVDGYKFVFTKFAGYDSLAIDNSHFASMDVIPEEYFSSTALVYDISVQTDSSIIIENAEHNEDDKAYTFIKVSE